MTQIERKVYCYNIQPQNRDFERWKEKKYPGHLLYGITEFEKYNISIILHKFKWYNNRLIFAIYNATQIIFSNEKYDVLYAVHSLGLEIVILLKIFRLYNKPIILWQHRIVHKSNYRIINFFHKMFYSVINKMFFFTQRHIDESVVTGNLNSRNCYVIKWGPDLKFYDYLIKNNTIEERLEHIVSTGKESRDFNTLTKAFTEINIPIDIYTAKINGSRDYEKEFAEITNLNSNINFSLVEGVSISELSLKIASSYAVAVCCTKQKYSVGLSSIVEAMAFGKPVIITNNPYLSIDVEKFNCGLKVDYEDVDGWIRAVNYLNDNKIDKRDMGKNGRNIVEEEYNLSKFSLEIVEHINDLL